jgi:hypothetical protein
MEAIPKIPYLLCRRVLIKTVWAKVLKQVLALLILTLHPKEKDFSMFLPNIKKKSANRKKLHTCKIVKIYFDIGDLDSNDPITEP